MGLKDIITNVGVKISAAKTKLKDYQAKARAKENQERAAKLGELKKTREREEGRARLITLEQKETARIEKARAIINKDKRQGVALLARNVTTNQARRIKETPPRQLWGDSKPNKKIFGGGKKPRQLWG